MLVEKVRDVEAGQSDSRAAQRLWMELFTLKAIGLIINARTGTINL